MHLILAGRLDGVIEFVLIVVVRGRNSGDQVSGSALSSTASRPRSEATARGTRASRVAVCNQLER